MSKEKIHKKEKAWKVITSCIDLGFFLIIIMTFDRNVVDLMDVIGIWNAWVHYWLIYQDIFCIFCFFLEFSYDVYSYYVHGLYRLIFTAFPYWFLLSKLFPIFCPCNVLRVSVKWRIVCDCLYGITVITEKIPTISLFQMSNPRHEEGVEIWLK